MSTTLRSVHQFLRLSSRLSAAAVQPVAAATLRRSLLLQPQGPGNGVRCIATSAPLSDSRQEQQQQSVPQLLPGDPAPTFSGKALMPDQSFADLSLADFSGKYLVLFFYPADFTFVCPTEIVAFSDRVEEFRQIGCEVVGCSTDTHFVHLAWSNTDRKAGGLGRLSIPLLADPGHAVSRAYGVLRPGEGLAYRGLFIIDAGGRLRQVTVNDMPIGRSVDETLRLVQALQFTDSHGEVCPANWRPGAKAMKPHPQLSKEYFQSS